MVGVKFCNCIRVSTCDTMSVSGVRNSCEMLVKKRSFDWFSASTSCICFCSYFNDSRSLILDLYVFTRYHKRIPVTIR